MLFNMLELDPVVQDVVAKLQASAKTSREIADEAGVEFSWLRMFRRGKIANPGVIPFRKVEAWALLHAESNRPAEQQTQ